MASILNFFVKRPKQSAIGLLVALAVYIGYSFWLRMDLPLAKAEMVRFIQTDLAVQVAKKELHISQPDSQPTAQDYEQYGKDIQPFDQLQIDSMTVRGLGTTVVAKLKVSLAGQPLPTGQDTYYLVMKYYWFQGWTVRRRTSVNNYNMAWYLYQ
jgi:hypothetical protein